MTRVNSKPRFICDFHVPPIDILRSNTASTIMVILHGINKRQEGALGLSFPEYSDESLGNLIRVVSYDKNDLTNFKRHPLIQLLKKNQSVDIPPIRESTEQQSELRFIRDRRNDRRIIGHWTNLGLSEKEAEEKISVLDKITDPLHYIWIRSKSGHLFKIYIRKESSPQRHDGSFSSYGLSSAGATVPG
ncbi:type I-F CRISPR-associated endoribonuclease Cas6/Csy4 [Endozoicomonas sp. OPT23]|uniref:type I-F CRISPR-associated endoribonuclease Cas6/Csy4 n=1 Tax=Endozoicomonas sp. OPT23 TaxID=2072845 RepID=UPI00129A1036|nr:type I-F CRISPR-associated endoribonuclease Cas6/Csy4 [Endozoicomonas sp. OPT23]MRI34281.1 type I-F CRISPR-associated endoribonuclease Cas6/Csy4 [Endozoicomonas sp. OPT23]